MSAYEKALKLASADSPDLVAAESKLVAASNEGDARASYALATWYLNGNYYKRNFSKAIPLLKAAAKDGVTAAMFDLAICYEKATGVRRSYKKALELYLLAALRGDSASMYEVGRCYYYGLGTKQDRRIATIWFDEHLRNANEKINRDRR